MAHIKGAQEKNALSIIRNFQGNLIGSSTRACVRSRGNPSAIHVHVAFKRLCFSYGVTPKILIGRDSRYDLWVPIRESEFQIAFAALHETIDEKTTRRAERHHDDTNSEQTLTHLTPDVGSKLSSAVAYQTGACQA